MMSVGNGPVPLGRATAARMTPLSVLTCSHETESGAVGAGACETLGGLDLPLSGNGDAVRRAQPVARNESSVANAAMRLLPQKTCLIRVIICSVVMSGPTPEVKLQAN